MLHTFYNSLSENIDAVASYDFENKKVFGSAYLVYRDGNTLEKYFGYRSLGEDAPVDGSTLFRLASMTKPITAVATMILVERGMISLDDTVDKFLPEFANIKLKPFGGEESVPEKLPTVKTILTHTSGLGSVQEKMRDAGVDDKKDIDSLVNFCLKIGLDFEPDSMQKYSGVGAFDVLTKIIETVSGEDFFEFLKKEILEPCGMKDTTFVPTDEQMARLIEMHDRRDCENVAHKMPDGCIFADIPCTHYLGGAGLVSTMDDYARFAKMLLNNGKAENGRILSEETVSLMRTPHFFKHKGESWGLGMRVIIDGHSSMPTGCFGWSGAYGSHFWIDPSNGLFAVFMKNSLVDGGAGNESSRNFEKAVYSSI